MGFVDSLMHTTVNFLLLYALMVSSFVFVDNGARTEFVATDDPSEDVTNFSSNSFKSSVCSMT